MSWKLHKHNSSENGLKFDMAVTLHTKLHQKSRFLKFLKFFIKNAGIKKD